MADTKPAAGKTPEPAAPAPEAPTSDAGSSRDALLAAAQVKAPSLTAEFVQKYGLTDEDLEKLARGELSPPPTVGPEHSVDLHYVNGGWQITPVGVKPEDVGKDAISR